MLIGVALWIPPISLEILPVKRMMVADPVRTIDQCLPDSATVPSVMEPIKDIKESFNSLGWLF